MGNIKEAFLKISRDINKLKKDKKFLEESIIENRKKLFEILNILTDLTLKLQLSQRSINYSNKHSDNQLNSHSNTLNADINTIGIDINKLNTNLNTLNNINTGNIPVINKIKTNDNSNNLDLSIGSLNTVSDIQNISIYTLANTLDRQTQKDKNKTSNAYISTYNLPLGGLNSQNLSISKGNQGVQTNKQTIRQTDKKEIIIKNIRKNTVDDAVDILSSLDSVRKRLRLDFKSLTDQEWLVFSTLYTLEEENSDVNYRIIANKLSLTESSIRDYIARLIKKGIPINKKKVNNKNIYLSVSENLKKVAPLHQILELREIR